MDELDRYLPTPEILNKKFGRFTYKTLPKMFIRATKNNTVITGYDGSVSVWRSELFFRDFVF